MALMIKEIVIFDNSTVLDAIKAIDRGAIQLALVVDSDQRLKATVTDGDVRRASHGVGSLGPGLRSPTVLLVGARVVRRVFALLGG